MALNAKIKKNIIRGGVALLSIFFICLIVLIIFKGGVMRSYTAALKENMLFMQGIKLVYIIDNESYVNLFSKSGYADKDNNSVSMESVQMEYSSPDLKIDASADNGQYELERFVNVYGNVKGVINGMRFDAGENGTMTYDYKDGKGEVQKGVTLYQGNNSINAGSVNFDTNENFVLFKDNVTVDYIIGSK